MGRRRGARHSQTLINLLDFILIIFILLIKSIICSGGESFWKNGEERTCPFFLRLCLCHGDS